MRPRDAIGSAEKDPVEQRAACKSDLTDILARLKPLFLELLPNKYYGDTESSTRLASSSLYQYLADALRALEKLDTEYIEKNRNWFVERDKYLSQARHFRKHGRVCLAKCRICLTDEQWNYLANMTVEAQVVAEYEAGKTRFEALGPSSGSGAIRMQLRQFLLDAEALKEKHPTQARYLADASVDLEKLMRE